MPAEKMLTSISKPALILPSQSLSIHFIDAGRDRGHDHRADEHVDLSELTMTPIVASVATTLPRSAVDQSPRFAPMSGGSR